MEGFRTTCRPPRGLLRTLPWTGAEVALVSIINFMLVILLTALLGTVEFGRAALAVAVVGLLEMLFLAGLVPAIVRAPSVDSEFNDSAFCASLIVGGAGFLLTWVVAPWISVLVDDAHLAGLIRAQAVGSLFIAGGSLPHALLLRKMRGREVSIRNIATKACGLILAVGLAIGGAGAWSVVAGNVGGAALGLLLFWAPMGRLPRLRVNLKRLRDCVPTYGFVALEAVLWSATTKLVVLVLGAMSGPAAAGVFQLGSRLIDELRSMIDAVIARYLMSLFGEWRRRGQDRIAGLFQVTAWSTYAMLPVLAGAALTAPDLIRLTFQVEWYDVGAVAAIIALFGAVSAPRSVPHALLRADGRNLALLLLAAVSCSTALAGSVLLASHGVVWATIGWATRGLITLPLSFWLVHRHYAITMAAQIRPLLRPVVATLIMSAVVFAWIEIVGAGTVWAIMGAIVIGSVIYLIAFVAFEFSTVRLLLRSRRAVHISGGTNAV